MNKSLMTGDIHWTSRPGDAYRWLLVEHVARLLKQPDISRLVVLGDVTDAKDRHSATFVHAVIHAMETWASIKPVVVLMGNHDCLDIKHPFFSFLSRIPGVTFVSEPSVLTFGQHKVLAVPHVESWAPNVAWRKDVNLKAKHWNCLLAHATFSGSRVENGTTRDGVPRGAVKHFPRVYAGDVHVPQELGNVVCVGAPHAIKFGDHYTPRLIIADHDAGTYVSLTRAGVQGRVLAEFELVDGKIRRTAGAEPREGDAAKLRVHLSRDQFARWADIREALRKKYRRRGVSVSQVLVEVKESQVLERKQTCIDNRVESQVMAYCRANALSDDLVDVALSFLGDLS